MGQAPLRELGVVAAGDPLVPALARLREGQGRCLHVVDRDRPVGLLILENVGESLMVRMALSAAAAQPIRSA